VTPPPSDGPIAGPERRDPATEPPPPGQAPIVLAGLAVGVLLMGVQLWLLTVALELYLGGHGGGLWLPALVSGLIFAGGLLLLRLLGQRPRAAPPWP
jgi:hypothetical protein